MPTRTDLYNPYISPTSVAVSINGLTVTLMFMDKEGNSVELHSNEDLRKLMLIALQKLEAHYSLGATGLPKKAK